jgi:RimJ/RimL family protein N-acetyltransferase
VTEGTGAVALTTPRLLLRAFRAEDLEPYAAMNADPDVMRYLGGPMTRAGSDQIAARANELHAREGIGLLAIERRHDGAFVGMCGLHRLLDWYPDDIEIGWRLAPAYWGHGYASEAAAAWLDHGFTARGLPRVISVADLPNLRSVAVMHRLGMVLDHRAELEYEGETFAAAIHAISFDRWRGGAQRSTCACVS